MSDWDKTVIAAAFLDSLRASIRAAQAAPDVHDEESLVGLMEAELARLDERPSRRRPMSKRSLRRNRDPESAAFWRRVDAAALAVALFAKRAAAHRSRRERAGKAGQVSRSDV